MRAHARIALVAALALGAIVLGAELAEARRAPRVQDHASEVLDALVSEDRLVTLEREPCDAGRAFEESECASLRARDAASDRELWLTTVPIRVRGLIQLELADADGSGHGFLLRAHDQGVLVGPDGRASAPFRVPPSTFREPVGVEQAGGVFLFREHGGCSAFVVGRSELGSGGRYVRGVESHVYPHGGGPHDTVCFGFTIRPVGEVRVGTRPAPRGARGELRHALSTLSLVAVTELHHPAPAGNPSVVALGPRGVAWQTEVGGEGWRIDRAAMTGTGSSARCSVDVTDGPTHVRVELACTSGRVLSRTTLADATASADASTPPDAGPVAWDRRGIALPRFPRCAVTEGGGQYVLRFDGERALVSARRILVLDQRGDDCIAVELAEATHPTDTLHRLSR